MTDYNWRKYDIGHMVHYQRTETDLKNAMLFNLILFYPAGYFVMSCIEPVSNCNYLRTVDTLFVLQILLLILRIKTVQPKVILSRGLFCDVMHRTSFQL